MPKKDSLVSVDDSFAHSFELLSELWGVFVYRRFEDLEGERLKSMKVFGIVNE